MNQSKKFPLLSHDRYDDHRRIPLTIQQTPVICCGINNVVLERCNLIIVYDTFAVLRIRIVRCLYYSPSCGREIYSITLTSNLSIPPNCRESADSDATSLLLEF